MKHLTHKLTIPLLYLVLATFVSCIPVAMGEPNQWTSVPLSTASQTKSSTQTFMPTASLTVSETPQPATRTATSSPTASETPRPPQSVTSTALPATAKPPRPTRTATQTPTISETVQSTATETPPAPSATNTQCPIPTPEVFDVEPVTSPTDQLSQIITVYLGNGEEVTVVTESGTFTVTGSLSPYLVEVSLLPDAVHHLQVFGRVKVVISSYGCVYGGYTMSTTFDRYGAPLTIVQGIPVP